MNCYLHPEREAVGNCAACGQPVCPECKVILVGRVYCNPCVEKMYLAAMNRPGWFQQHLNLTLVIGLAAATLLNVAGIVVLMMLEPEATEETLAFQTQIMGYILSFFIMFPLAGWVIRQKGRNPWNVLWLILPFGWVMILLMTNMHKVTTNRPGSPPIA
jgi:uncharacterized membrane protein